MLTVKVEGERVVVAGFTKWNARIVKRLEFLVRRHAIEIQNKAKLRAPKDSGRLANSIFADVEADGTTGVVGTNLQYAPYVEFGTGIYAAGGNGRQTPWVYFSPRLGRFVRTSGTPPQPFLLPSFNEQVPLFASDVEKMLREETK